MPPHKHALLTLWRCPRNAWQDCVQLLGGPRDMRYVAEDNLEEVEMYEKRIHHPLIPHAFEHFDSKLGMFVPDEMLMYQYPNPCYDNITTVAGDDTAPEKAVRTLALEIAGTLQDGLDTPRLQHHATQLFGELLCSKIQAWKTRDAASERVHNLLADLWAIQNICHMALTQREAHSARDGVEFHIGEVVKHQLFGFRGAIVGWDKRPVVDVSRWEGVVDLPSRDAQPFYHILPDTEDCIRAFGEPRDSRYVAQENLQPLPHHERLISSRRLAQMLPQYCDTSGRFVVSDTLAFQYRSDDCTIESSLDRESCDSELSQVVNTIAAQLNSGIQEARATVMPDLMWLLRDATRKADAEVIEETIWACWCHHTDLELASNLRHGVRLMEMGKHVEAMQMFGSLLEQDATWTEAYNKRATAACLAGEYDESLADIEKVLGSEPNHFGALSGQGLVKMKQKDFEGAILSFRAALDVHPWMCSAVSGAAQAQLMVLAGEGSVRGAD